MQTWEASFGDIDLSPTADNGDVTVEVHGLKRGKHTRITAVADSLIQDGSIERVVRDDNRDVQLILCLDGTDSEALAQFEATLFREVNRGRNEFRWTPPDGFGATAVFDVLWADLAFADEDTVWDLDEIRGRRNYVLTMRCLPFARSVDPFTVQGLTSGASASTTVIDDASSAAAWSASDGTAVTASGGAVSMPLPTPDTYGRIFYGNRTLYRSGSVTLPTDAYVYVDWRMVSATPADDFKVRIGDGVGTGSLTHVGESGAAPRAGFVRSMFRVVLGFTTTRLDINAWGTVSGATGSPAFEVDELSYTNQAPYVGTLRQKLSGVEVPGSARTPTSLALTHPSSGLGNVLLFTGASGRPAYQPALSPYRAGTLTADATYVSGKRSNASVETYDIPVANLNPGLHQIVMRAKPGAYTVSARLRVGGVDVGDVVTGRASSELLAADSAGFPIHTLGSLVLPPHEVPMASTAVVRVTVTRTSGTQADPIDEVWAFYMPDDGTAHLSAVPAGTARRVRLDAPTLTSPHPACYIGTATDDSDTYAVSGSTSNWDEHVVTAGVNQIFSVTTTALDAAVTATGYAAWLTHPAA